MLSSLSVGATFEVRDLASQTLKLIADQLKVLNAEAEAAKKALSSLSRTAFAGLDDRLGTISKSVAGIGDAGARAAERMAASFDTATLTMSASLKRMAEQMASVSVPGVASGPNTFLGGPRGSGTPLPGWHGRGGGGGHIGGSGAVPLPGDRHASLGSTPAMAAAGVGLWSLSEATRLEDTIYRSLVTSGHQVTGNLTDDPYYQPLRSIIMDAYAKTGLPLGDVEDSALNAIRLTAPLPLDQRIQILRTLMPEATSEAFLKKGTSVDDAARAMTELMHMSGQYQGPQADALLKGFVYLSTQTDASLEQTERAASYAIPLLRIADFDPKQLLFGLTAMQRAGILNSKSGTWIENMLERSFPGTSVMSRMAFQKHEGALKELGLVDDNDKQTFLDANGHPDLFKFFDIVSAHARELPKNEMLGVFKQLFGAQGERAAAFFSDPPNQSMLKASIAGEGDFISGNALWDAARGQDPAVMFRTSLAANTELIAAAEKELPEATKAFKELVDDLHAIGDVLNSLNAYGSGLGKWLHDKLGIPDLTSPGNLDTSRSSGGWWPWSKPTLGGGLHSSIYGPGNGVGAGAGITLSGGSSSGSLTALINEVSAAEGIDPRIMEGIRAGESGHGSNYDRNLTGSDESYGPFQLNRKHPGDLGSLFERETGLDLSDPSTIPAQARWVAKYIKRTGSLSPWAGYHGTRDADPRWGDSGYVPSKSDSAAMPPVPGSNGRYPGRPVPGWRNKYDDIAEPGSPYDDPSEKAHSKQLHITNNIIVDGKRLAGVVTKHQFRARQYTRGPSSFDGSTMVGGVDRGYADAV